MAALTKRRLCLNLALVLSLLLLLPLFSSPAAASSPPMIIDGAEYPSTVSQSGIGWSYTYSSGMGYLRLNGYCGGAILLPWSSAVEYEGENLISAADGKNALYCTGETLSVGSRDPAASLTLTGGSGATAIFADSVSLWGWGMLSAYGGTEAAAVWGRSAVLITLEQMVLSGSGQMAVVTDMGGVIRISGAHTYYAGMSAETAVESVFYGGEFYLRAEPDRAVITLDACGGTVNGEESCSFSLTVTTSGSDLQLSTPLREGFTFLGWNTQPDGSGEQPPPRLYSGGEITYYALWERDPLPVPGEMLTAEGSVIYLAIYTAGGQLWHISEIDPELAAITLPELPEEGMSCIFFCVDALSFIPLFPPSRHTL